MPFLPPLRYRLHAAAAAAALMFLFLLFAHSPLAAQSMVAWSDVAVTEEGAPFNLPWAGGMNNPQFSAADFDGDGEDDLVVFDRRGNVPTVYRYTGAAGAYGYRVDHGAARFFPKLHNWAILRDLNCDGAEELITSSEALYVLIYPGFRDANNALRWTVDDERLAYDRAGFEFFLEVTAIDIPAVEDVDGDGDRDILTFNPGGGYVEFFRNQAAENGDPCGPLDLVYADSCWGNFYESGLSTTVDLGACGSGRPARISPAGENSAAQQQPLQSRSGIHAGSTFAAFDAEMDGDLDLILGDLSFSQLVFLENGGSAANADIVSQDPNYPSGDVPYNVNQFPAPFVLDIDRDGVEDLVAAPNSEVQGRGVGQVWYYRNTAASGMAAFERQTQGFLVGEMPDFGHGANPVFFDHNGDGLLDLVVGNEGYLPGIGAKRSQLALLENVGTASEPAFEVVDLDYGGLSIYGFVDLKPAFGDIDGDGDEDMIVGEEEGLLHWFANTSSSGAASFSLQMPGWQGIDVGKNATPELHDLDGDGDLDLLVGEKNGNVTFFRNTGSASSATMTEENSSFGGIAPLSGLTNVGYSQVDVVAQPGTGALRLYVGSLNGRIWRYDNWAGDLGATFTPFDSTVGGIDDGERSRVAVADLDGDGILDLLAGNMRGGLVLYREGSYPNGWNTPSVNGILPALQPYPNPARQRVLLDLPEGFASGEGRLQAFDPLGRLVLDQPTFGTRTEWPVADWSPGLYALFWRPAGQAPSGASSGRLLIAR